MTVTTFKVTFYGATNTRGARFKVSDLRNDEVSWHSYDYSAGGGYDSAQSAVFKHIWKMNGIPHHEQLHYSGTFDKGYYVTEVKDV